MPFSPRDNRLVAMDNFAPLTSNVEAMITAATKLQSELDYVIDDSEAYGLLTEDTFLENCPEILKQLERISHLAGNSCESLNFEDEVFDPAEPSGLAQSLFLFIGRYCEVLSVLSTHVNTIQKTGPWFDSLSRSINSQKASVQRFKAALDARYFDVKVRTASSWGEFENVMNGCTAMYPLPSTIVVVE